MFYAYRGSTTLLILNASPILTTLKAEYNYKLTMQQMVSPDPSSWTIRQVLDEDGEEEGGDVAMLHFEDEDDVERFLKSKKLRPNSSKKGKKKSKAPPKLDREGVIEEWSKSAYHDASELKAEVDAYMAEYEADESSTVVDEDGWTTVRHSSSTSETRAAALRTTATKRKRKKKRLTAEEGLKDFYKFQNREKKGREKEELRRGWERAREEVKRRKKE